jgi:hypothetical protein
MASMLMLVNKSIIASLEKSSLELAKKCVEDCCNRNGLNVEEEWSKQGLDSVKVKILKKEKKEKKEKIVKKKCPMPFSKSLINEGLCDGLSYNHGLFTQCLSKKMENGSYCEKCQSEADSNSSGIPLCGNISERLEKELYEFKDSKGRKPISYLKVLEKLKISVETALEEGKNSGLEIDEVHLTNIVKSKDSKMSRGRPKKAKTVVEAEGVSDLFAKLTADVSEDVPESKQEVVLKKSKLSDEEKALKKAALIEAKEAEKEARKLEKEAKLALEKEAKKAELEAKKAEREAKRNQEKAEKAAAKAASKKESKKKPPVEEKAVVQEEAKPEKVTVTRMQINGKAYLKSSNNILYDPETKEEVGLWDQESKTIKELPDEEEEEEEDYEEED